MVAIGTRSHANSVKATTVEAKHRHHVHFGTAPACEFPRWKASSLSGLGVLRPLGAMPTYPRSLAAAAIEPCGCCCGRESRRWGLRGLPGPATLRCSAGFLRHRGIRHAHGQCDALALPGRLPAPSPLTISPALTTSCGSLTNLSASAETWTGGHLMHTDIDEAPGVGDVGDDAFSIIPGSRSELLDTFAEGRRPNSGVVTARHQFLEDVLHGRQAEFFIDIFCGVHRFDDARIADHFPLMPFWMSARMRSTTGWLPGARRRGVERSCRRSSRAGSRRPCSKVCRRGAAPSAAPCGR